MMKMTMVVLGGGPSGGLPGLGLLKPNASNSIFVSSSSTIITLNRRSQPPPNLLPRIPSNSEERRLMTCLRNTYTNTIAGGSHAFQHHILRNAKTSIATTTSQQQQQQGEGEGADEDEDEDEVGNLRKIKEAANTLDIRVGKILIAYKHPEADSLYVEEVDVGEPEPRIICSGLVNFIPINNLQHLNVVVLANLKPRNMRGVRSFGMLMAASDAEHENVELLMPPENSVPGQRIWFGSVDEKETLPDVASPNQIQKKKIWELVQTHLKTDDSGIAALGSHPMRTDAGVVVARSLKNARIS